ncbi:MAG: hypothetical protein DRJ97_08145 [Thermoprotei archaeon]|nr:MAG: hypothetical protein DRJ97_08145 [Thermoprotei archaeon]
MEGSLEHARARLVEKLVKGEEELRARRAGWTTLSSIARLKIDPESRASSGVTNGAAIRALPIGLAVPFSMAEKLLEAVVELSSVTHGGAEAMAAASAIAHAASKALEHEDSVEDVVEAGVAGARRLSVKLARLIDAAVDLAEEVEARFLPDELPRRVGVSSPSWESVPAAFCVFKASRGELRTALALAVGAGGDTDSVAAMAAGLCGALKGPSTIPEGWLLRVEGLNLRELAERLVEVRGRLKQGGWA